MSYQRNPFDFYNNRRRPSYSSTWEPAPSRADVINRRDRETREAHENYRTRQPPRFSDSQHHQRFVRNFPENDNGPRMPYHRDAHLYHHRQYSYETRRQAEYRNDRQNTLNDHHYYGNLHGNDDYQNNNKRRQNYHQDPQRLDWNVPEEDNRPRMPYHKDFNLYHQRQNSYGATPQVDHLRDGRPWKNTSNDNPHNGILHGDRDYRNSKGGVEGRSHQDQYDHQGQNWNLPSSNMGHHQQEQSNYEQDYNYKYSSSNASRPEMNSEIPGSELLGRADPSLDNRAQFGRQEQSTHSDHEGSIPTENDEDNTPEYDQEEEEACDAQPAQPYASNLTRIKEEVIDPEYEKSLDDLKIDYEEIHAIFDTQRNIEPPWSRGSPKWQEFMTAFRSGDTVRSEHLRLEIMAEEKKKKQAGSSDTVGTDLTDGADEEDDTEEMDMEDSNNNPPLNAQNIFSQEELDAGFQEQMEIYNRPSDQNSLAEASSSGIELKPEDVAASNEERTGSYQLRSAVKKVTKHEENVARTEKSTKKPKRAKKQSQKNAIPRVQHRATRSRQTAQTEARKLRSRK